MTKGDVVDLEILTSKANEMISNEISQEITESKEGDLVIQEKIIETFETLEDDILSHQENRKNYESELQNLIESIKDKFQSELVTEERARLVCHEKMLKELEELCLKIDSYN